MKLGGVSKMKNFELFFRQTTFSEMLLVEIWDGLSLMERIELLIYFVESGRFLNDELKIKALSDSNPVGRMLAVQCSNICQDKKPDLYSRLKEDPSALVRAVATAGVGSFFVIPDVFKSWNHIERLTHIALSDSFSGESLAEFIISGLQSQSLLEKEAAELVCEFVQNPKLTKGLGREPVDGLDWYSIGKEFKAIWNLTTCTPWFVHSSIARKYPLEIGDNFIPVETINRMKEGAIKNLIWRQYKPLLKLIEKNPKQFSEGVLKELELARY